MSRRAGRGARGHPPWLATGRRESLRTAPPSAAARLGRRTRVRWGATWLWTRLAPRRFSREAQVSLSPEMAAAVTERTEGWPVGLYLAAVIAATERRGADDRRRRPIRRGLPVPRVADGAARDCPAVPAAHGGARSAVAPLCDAMLGEPAPRTRLRAWRPRACSWSRSTASVSGTATTRCSESSSSVSCVGSSPTSSSKLHLRAADWYESNGSRDGRRAPAAHHRTRPMRPAGGPRWSFRPKAGQMSTVQRWLSIARRPDVSRTTRRSRSLAGWVAVSYGQAAEAQRLGGVRRRRLVRPGALGRHRLVRLGPGDAACYVRRRSRADDGRRERRAEEPPGARGATSARLGGGGASARWRLDRASALFAEAFVAAGRWATRRARHRRVRSLPVLDVKHGRWEEAEGTYGPALAKVIDRLPAVRLRSSACSSFAVAARLAVHRGDLSEARSTAHPEQ